MGFLLQAGSLKKVKDKLKVNDKDEKERSKLAKDVPKFLRVMIALNF